MNTHTVLADSISALSLTITILVIVGMAVAFGLLFWLYSLNKKKLIDLGGEDSKLINTIQNDYNRYKAKNVDVSLNDFIISKNKKEKIARILMDVLSWCLIGFFLIITIIGLVFRSKGQQIYLGKTTYMTIQTGSMSEKNMAHPYFEQVPNNQIAQYSLIGIKKVAEEDLHSFDIVAFKVNGKVYVHRIIQILEVNGIRSYTTQGDANSGSLSFEIGLNYNQILGKYTGTKSLGMGVFLTYLQSNAGIIAFIFAMLLLFVIDISEMTLSKSYKKRMNYLIEQLAAGGEINE